MKFKYLLERWVRAKFSFGYGLLCVSSLVAFQAYAQNQNLPEAVPGEYIVKYRNNGLLQNVKAKIQGKANLKAVLTEGSLYHVSMKSENLAAIQSDPDIEYIEPNFYLVKFQSQQAVTIGKAENVVSSAADVAALSSTAYWQSFSGAQTLQSWSIASPYNVNNRPVVAIVDTGLDPSHNIFVQTQALWTNPGEIPNNGVDDDFNGYVDDVSGWNFINNTKTFTDDEGHGTHVAGIVVGTGLDIFSNSLDYSQVRLMPLKFLDSTGAGSTANAVRAIYYAVNNGAKVINCSWGGGSYSQSLHEALTYAYTHEVLVVTAAGNNASNNDAIPMYPANYDVPSLISVAATYDSDTLASFSNYGASSVHVAAPGVYIYSTYLYNQFAMMSGTSMAAPFVAGIAAMAMREAPSLTGYQIKGLIASSADVLTSKLSGKVSTQARVNEYKLIQSAKVASATTLAVQPAYSPVYKSERAPASEAGSSAGCGLVQGVSGSAGPLGGGALGFSLMALIPLVVWLAYRMRAVDTGKGRRAHERFKLNSEIKVNVGGRELVASMNTISMGGLSFNAEAALEKGGIITMKIASPDGREEIEIQGHVVWSENSKAYGVQFSGAKEGALSAISQWTKGLAKAS